jgi:hypothetical protein
LEKRTQCLWRYVWHHVFVYRSWYLSRQWIITSNLAKRASVLPPSSLEEEEEEDENEHVIPAQPNLQSAARPRRVSRQRSFGGMVSSEANINA